MNESPRQPSVNLAFHFFIIMLWIVPCGFALVSVYGLDELSRKSRVFDSSLSIFAVFGLNLALIFGAGLYYAKLSTKSLQQSGEVFNRLILFCVVQVFIVPAFCLVYAFFFFF